MVDFAKRMGMAVVNTFFQKGQEHRVRVEVGADRWTSFCVDDVM